MEVTETLRSGGVLSQARPRGTLSSYMSEEVAPTGKYRDQLLGTVSRLWMGGVFWLVAKRGMPMECHVKPRAAYGRAVWRRPLTSHAQGVSEGLVRLWALPGGRSCWELGLDLFSDSPQKMVWHLSVLGGQRKLDSENGRRTSREIILGVSVNPQQETPGGLKPLIGGRGWFREDQPCSRVPLGHPQCAVKLPVSWGHTS